jgi:CBS domain-containing protein
MAFTIAEGERMFDLPVKSLMEPKKLIMVSQDTTVSEAAALMASKNTGAVLVIDNQQLVGIFTERDAVFRVLAKGQDALTTRLRDVMTVAPSTVTAGTSYGHALLLMHEKGFRHVPVVDGDRVVGIVASRNAMDPQLEEFVSEARRREHYR